MRIVLSYATEFDFHEGHQIARALVSLGHDVHVVNADVKDAKRFWPSTATYRPDVSLGEVLAGAAQAFAGAAKAASLSAFFLYIEPRGLLPRGLDVAPCHTACILCDTMLSLEPRLDIGKLFDDVLLYHPHASELMPHDRARVHWTPLAIDPELFVDRGGARDLEVAFVGRTDNIWDARKALLEQVAARYTTNDFFGPRCTFQEIADIYNRARIVIHVPIADALNPRIFEAMGCGAMLVTGRVRNKLETLFTEGTHLVTYDNAEGALRQIDYYLAHDDERARIARAGSEEVHRSHTYAKRLRDVLDRLQTLERGTAPARRMSPRAVEDIYQRRHKQAGQADALVRRALEEPAYSIARYRTLVRAGTTFLRHRTIVRN